jgi:hypothetical protein
MNARRGPRVRGHRRTIGTVAAIAAFVAVAVVPLGAQSSAGRGTLFIGTYDEKVLVLDEATLTVQEEIPLSIGIPLGVSASFDKRTLYVLNARYERVEMIDVATRRSKGTFTLSKDSLQVRINGMNVDPRERFAVLLVNTVRKHPDRYEISRPMLLKYDLASRTVTDTIPWPKGEERDFAQIMFSPDGASMYFVAQDDVLIYDTATLKQVDRWELGRTLTVEGMGRLGFGFPGDLYEEPGFFTGLFRSTDPVNRRTMMGVARMDLANRKVEFYQLGPSAPVSFRLLPGKTKAIGLQSQVGNYQFWTFDLVNRRVASRTEFRGRPRMGLTVGSGGDVFYIHTAGHTIDVYDVNTFRLVRTVELPADMIGFLLIPPAAPRPGN